jgi:hypothetical protein
MFVFPDSSVREMILALEGDVNLFPALGVMRLYTNNLNPTKTNVPADFTELTIGQVPGYAAVAMTWGGAPIRDTAGEWVDYANDAAFVATGPPPAPQIVYGWFWTNAAGTVMVGAGLLVAPMTFVSTGDGIRLEPQLKTFQATGLEVRVGADAIQS